MHKLLVGSFVGVMSMFAASSAGAILLCDNFGKTWDITPSGDTLQGVRDTDGIECGEPLFVHGMFGPGFGGTHFVVTSLYPPTSTCQAVIWDGRWDGSSALGTWVNENGTKAGPFTFTSGACPAIASGVGDDPSK